MNNGVPEPEIHGSILCGDRTRDLVDSTACWISGSGGEVGEDGVEERGWKATEGSAAVEEDRLTRWG